MYPSGQLKPLEFIEGQEKGLIYGVEAGSVLEWRVAVALVKLGHNFFYQFEIFSGGNIRGNIILDFLVLTTIPKATPILVHGEYWHTGSLSSEDRLKEMIIDAEFRDTANPLLILWEYQLSDQDEAIKTIRTEIGVNR